MQNENFVSIVGRITRNELRFTPSNEAVCNIGIARNPQIKRGDKWEDGPAEFYDVTAWRKQAERSAELPVGALVRVTGRLRYHAWEDNEGNKRNKVDIVADSISVETIVAREIESQKGHIEMTFGKAEGEERAERPGTRVAEEFDYNEEEPW